MPKRKTAARYSALTLLRRGTTASPWPPAWRHHDVAPSYDVIIIGGGIHGLATAYYLATNHGISDDLEYHKIVVCVVKSEGAAKEIISDKASSIGIGTNKARVLPTLGEGV